jgi:hypothetical protein
VEASSRRSKVFVRGIRSWKDGHDERSLQILNTWDLGLGPSGGLTYNVSEWKPRIQSRELDI